jgi:hypothetical protein
MRARLVDFPNPPHTRRRHSIERRLRVARVLVERENLPSRLWCALWVDSDEEFRL